MSPPRLILAVAVSTLGLTAPACATNDGVFASDEDLVASIVTTTIGGGVSTTGAFVALDFSDSDRDDDLLSSRTEIEVAIARGNGPWINDVATRLALPEGLVPRLGATLRAQRGYLLGVLASVPLTPRDWLSAVGAAACCDPWLRAFALPRVGCTPPSLVDDTSDAPPVELRCAP